MNIETRIKAFVKLGEQLQQYLDTPTAYPILDQAIEKSAEANPWFIPQFEISAIENIIPWLTESKLKEWVKEYCCPENSASIGVIMAGNIPLVGFHDYLSTLICGHRLFAKLSGKDRHLLPTITQMLTAIEPEFAQRIKFVSELPEQIDAFIATGSDNTARYFNYYYKNKPRIIRQNRNSVAILNGDETEQELEGLSKDICMYFGLGCRNVSKIYIPHKNILSRLQKAVTEFNWMLGNRFYANNISFQKARLKTLETPFNEAGPLLFIESNSLNSPIGVLNFEVYTDIESVNKKLKFEKENIQCIINKKNKNALPLGESQRPKLDEYADGVDTMKFLVTISA